VFSLVLQEIVSLLVMWVGKRRKGWIYTCGLHIMVGIINGNSKFKCGVFAYGLWYSLAERRGVLAF